MSAVPAPNPAAGYYPIAVMAMALLLAGTLEPTPLFELYHRVFGLTPAEISAVFAAYAASLIPGLLVFGGLSDRLGRRVSIVLAFALLIVAALVFASAQGLIWLVAARVVQGFAMGIGLGASAAAIREWMPLADVGRAGFWTVIAVAVGSAFGALLGGTLGEFAPHPLVTPYLVYIALLVAATAVVLRVPGRAHIGEPAALAPIGIPRAIRRPFLLSSAQSFIGWAGFALFIALVPTFLAESLGLHNLLVGALVITLLQIGSAAGSMSAGRLTSRVAIFVAMAGMGAGVWLLIAGVALHSYVAIALATLIAGAGGGISYLGGLNVINTIAEPEHRAGTISAYLVACYLGFSVPALGVGTAANMFGLASAFSGAAIALGLIAAAIMAVTTDANLRPTPSVPA